MKISHSEISDVLKIEPDVLGDERGFFMETYRADLFAASGITGLFVQDNHSASQKGVLRGLHYQIRQPQGKLVRVIVGEIFDVAVDLRRNSATLGSWVGEILSAKNKLQLWIPEGFAHGFYVLSDQAEVIYKTTDYYAPEWERSLLWSDPTLGIKWPLVNGQEPLVSEKDSRAKLFVEAELFESEKNK
jgi:dTDP-4-dehydrorhamnose 3,5-epimerase